MKPFSMQGESEPKSVNVQSLTAFFVQPPAKSAIAQSTSAISNIQLLYHPYSIAQQPPAPLIPPLVH